MGLLLYLTAELIIVDSEPLSHISIITYYDYGINGIISKFKNVRSLRISDVAKATRSRDSAQPMAMQGSLEHFGHSKAFLHS